MPVVNLKGGRDMAFKLAVFEGIKQSRTANSIWTWLQRTGMERNFDVVVLQDQDKFGQMLTETDRSGPDAVRGRNRALQQLGGQTLARPVVLWNPNYKFTYYGDVKGVKFNTAGDAVSERARARGGYYYQWSSSFHARVIRVTESLMPAWIVLFHELGHVKQYFEGGSEGAWTVRLNDTNAIEAENLIKHENPICTETSRSIRAHYKHSIHGFSDLAQRYSVGQKVNAWKCATSVTDRKILEEQLKAEADQSTLNNPASGIYHGFQQP